MKSNISMLEEKVYSGKAITYEDSVELLKEDINLLSKAANRIREKFMGSDVDLCSIMNAKCGKCSEDCKYCAQSVHYDTEIKEYDFVDIDKVLGLAVENEACGINRFAIVTSGKALYGQAFEKSLQSFKNLKKNTKLKLCASLGILNMQQLIRLKESGVSRYHHNIETSRGYFPKICTSHSFEDRINTINNAKQAGLSVCSGGIIGLGESFKDRMNMALELQALNIESIPINIFTPIKGTPLESIPRLSEEEILRTIAIFRFINPKAYIRLAGGRNFLSNYGEKAFHAGANAAISGNYLTTSGNKIEEDIHMINNLGLEVTYND